MEETTKLELDKEQEKEGVTSFFDFAALYRTIILTFTDYLWWNWSYLFKVHHTFVSINSKIAH